MAQTAAHLVDHVIPHVPVRQWVLTLPFSLRYLIAYNRRLSSGVRRIFVQTVLDWLSEKAASLGIVSGQGGGVTFQQRWGGSVNLNPHFHSILVDGLFQKHPTDNSPRFQPTPAPTDAEVVAIVSTIRTRVLAFLRREGALSEEESFSEADLLSQDAPTLAACYAGSVGGREVARIGRLPGPGRPVVRAERSAEVKGFSLHANVRIEPDDRDGLERLLRYVARPALCGERLSITPQGNVRYALRRPYRDGTWAVEFSPLAFIAKLAALVPPPRANLVTYHGVLAGHATLRPQVVPSPPPPRPAAATALPGEPLQGTESRFVGRRWYAWAELLKRVFLINILACPCGGKRRVLAMITQPDVIRAILDCLAIESHRGPVAPARWPPEADALTGPPPDPFFSCP